MGQKYPNILLILIDSARADHFSCYGYKRYCGEQIAIRTKQFKFIWFEIGNHMLFDLHKDPNEKSNIVDDSLYSQLYEEFLDLISKLKYKLEPEIKKVKMSLNIKLLKNI